ncbi:hypothetical protein SHELI_v1c03420 [Spiroplasma helicoides]|uniref:MOLPALP family lipoprotein n=1 Tax=Spiroplasma helicoides TaxID=216938 RepID=A0A1B3SK48_9MOLU|nr:lipoprotein [Spiroplasma helicoides]AOG60297.1 hypothetical protein SHELI_v1c03420 [Spiroplasma helicoides]
MKKLLSFLATISIVASSSGYAIACAKDKIDTNENANESQTLAPIASNAKAEIMSQYSKALFLNQYSLNDLNIGNGSTIDNYHYSPSEYFSNIKKRQIKDLNFSSSIDANFTNLSEEKMESAYSEYFNNNLLNDNTTIDDSIYKGGVINSEKAMPDFIGTVNTFLPILAQNLVNPDGSGIASLLSLLVGLQSSLSSFSNTLEPIIKSLTDNDSQVLKDFEDAFTFKVEANTATYSKAIQDSIISLSKSFNGIAGKDVSSITNFDTASTAIAENIGGLMDGSIKFSLDMSVIKYLPGIIKFVRVLLLYLDQFDESAVTNTTLTVDDVLKIKQAKIEEKDGKKVNSFDLQKWLRILKIMSKDEDQKGLNIFKNIINILFSTHDTVGAQAETAFYGAKNTDGSEGTYKNENEIYGRIIGDVLIKMMGQEFIEMNAQGNNIKIYIANLIKTLLNYGIGYNSGGSIEISILIVDIKVLLELIPSYTDTLPKFLGDLINKLNGVKNESGGTEWNSFVSDWIGYLWNDKKSLIGFSVKGIMNKPIGELMDMISGLGSSLTGTKSSDVQNKEDKSGKFDEPVSYFEAFLKSKSLANIVTDLDNSLSGKDVRPLNFDTLSSLFKALYADKKYNLAIAWSNKNSLFSGLGLKVDGTTVKDSPMYYFEQILKENRALLLGVLNFINSYLQDLNDDLAKLKLIAGELAQDIKVEYVVVSDSEFLYTVSFNDKKLQFSIKLGNDGDKSYISSISMKND